MATSTTKKSTKKPAKGTDARFRKASGGFTAEERAAMKARAQELKAAANRSESERLCLDAIASLPGQDRAMAKKIHAIVKSSAPELQAKTWYGMPAYANSDGAVVCFFQSADKFKARYATLGFNDAASLDDGVMWPTSFALKKLGASEEKRIAALVKKAVG
jgi:uncharacterized protein YdhG (YjbR/CyaY superfamily)